MNYPTTIDAIGDVISELNEAERRFGPMHSGHEGYAVILEEMDELKEHVWTRQGNRDVAAMRKEAMQVAAMAVRFMIDICDGGRGNV